MDPSSFDRFFFSQESHFHLEPLLTVFANVVDPDPEDPSLIGLLDSDPDQHIFNHGYGTGSLLFIKIQRNLEKS